MYRLTYTVNFPEDHIPYELHDLNGGSHEEYHGVLNAMGAISLAFPGATSFVFVVSCPQKD